MDLAEQAEREIGKEHGKGFSAGEEILTIRNLYAALVRDRCSLLKLRKAAEWTRETPKEQGDYWHWDGDEDHAPFIKQVMVSMPSGRTFAAYPDSRWCGVIGGWWQKIEQPSVAALRSALEGK